MNNVEIGLFIFCLIFNVSYSFFVLKINKLQSLAITAALALPFYFSITGLTQFSIVDEGTWQSRMWHFFTSDISNVLSYNAGEGRVTYLTGIIFYKLTNWIFHYQFDTTQFWFFLKLTHWLNGFIIIYILHYTLNKSLHPKSLISFYLIYFATMFCLPTNILALKVINYDLLSMLLGTLSLAILWNSSNDTKKIITASAIAFLASGEKLISSPIFLLTILWLSYHFSHHRYFKSNNNSKFSNEVDPGATKANAEVPFKDVELANKPSVDIRNQWIRNRVLPIGAAIFLSYIYCIAHFAILKILRYPQDLPFDLFSSTFSLTNFTWPITSIILGSKTGILDVSPLLLNLGYIICIGLISFIVNFALPKIKVQPIFTFVNTKVFYFVSVIFLISLFCSFFVNSYWHPFYPVSKGNFWPHGVGQVFQHFDAQNIFEHYLRSIGYSYAVFLNAIPTVIVLFAMYSLFKFSKLKPLNTSNKNSNIIIGLTILFTLIVPLGYGFIVYISWNRYFNIWILLFVLASLFMYFKNQLNMNLKIVSVLILFLILEIFPFSPLFGPFRPIWMNYSVEHSHLPLQGVMNKSWVGWGEELMLFGKKIETKQLEYINSNCKELNIYHNYVGRWLTKPDSVKTQFIANLSDINKLTNDDCNYFLINRSMTIRGEPTYPYKLAPLDQISFRGFDLAWIFSAKQLRENGYIF